MKRVNLPDASWPCPELKCSPTVTRSSDKYVDWKCFLGHVYNARIANRVNNESGCPFCSGNKILIGFNDLSTTHPELAEEADGWDPSEISFGSQRIVKWKCPSGHKWKASVASRGSVMGTGCPSCAIYGFDPNADGYFYLLEHEAWNLLQLGITNVPEDRMKKHKRIGWEVIEIRGPMTGELTRHWETDCLRFLRSKGVELGPKSDGGKFDGYSETWRKSDFPVGSIAQLFDFVRDAE